MTDHAANKATVAALLHEVATTPPGTERDVLATYVHDDAVWEIFHPFNRLKGIDEVARGFWTPLRESFPNYEYRPFFGIGGSFEGEDWVSTLGHVMGSFAHPWLGMRATFNVTYLRFGLNAVLREGKIARAYVLLDVVDVMRQAGYYPFRQMPGSPEQWPAPPASSGADMLGLDAELGARTLRVAREMQEGLAPPTRNLAEHRSLAKHSPHWHENMNWYGPAGIGSCRGRREYSHYHGRLFIQSFPDRGGGQRPQDASNDGPGHYIRVGDGHFAVTAGWPSLRGTHTGAGWLGLPASGQSVDMRVADWYRTDREDRLIDNWVLIDTLHILDQVGFDVLDDLRHLVDPSHTPG